MAVQLGYDSRMPIFDRSAEDEKLARIHAEEAEDLTQLLAEKHGLPYADLSIMPINMDALRLIDEAEAREAQAVAYDKSGRKLTLAVRDLESDAFKNLVSRLEGADYVLELTLASEKSIEIALARYADLSSAHADEEGVFGVSPERLAALQSLADIAAHRAHLEELLAQHPPAPPTKVLEEVVGSALALKASDVHFEPEEETVRLRLRLNGLLTDTGTVAPRTYRQLLSRIKLLSELKLNVTDRAQDGRFTIAVGERDIEIRTSVIPGNYGESVVLRVLDPEATQHSFADMGINEKLLARLSTEIRRPNGMLLTTGPTGSGKTTTLYSFLREIHTPDIKVVTLEDPVEYHLPGIVQTQVHGGERSTDDHGGRDDQDGYTFASGLRSILRQDPDVIMVGEIRDAEVAEVAIQAALTGHFVFSTLHTNTAAGAFPRLVDLGLDPKEFASAITVVMAQRLVRTLDPAARVEREPTAEEHTVIERVLASLPEGYEKPEWNGKVWSPDPSRTGGDGYDGRTGVHEAIFMDEELGAFLRENPSAGDIEKHVRRQGYLTLAQDAVLKVLARQTSIEEIMRVVDLPR